MRYIQGDIWQEAAEDGWVVIPTNTCVRHDETAVMGAGLAKDAAERFPELPKRLGNHIRQFDSRLYVDNPIICLPTKHNWRRPSQMRWVEQGCHELVDLARILGDVGDHRSIFLPQLGCGLGGLNWERQIRPVVDSILEGDRFVLVQK